MINVQELTQDIPLISEIKQMYINVFDKPEVVKETKEKKKN